MLNGKDSKRNNNLKLEVTPSLGPQGLNYSSNFSNTITAS